MPENRLARDIVVGILPLAVVAVAGGVWNWMSEGGLIRALGGATMVPESEEIQACRTIQAAAHDDIQTLEHEIQSAYTAIGNDHKALTEETQLRVVAIEKDRPTPGYASENAVNERIQQLRGDIDYRDRVIDSRRRAIDDVSNLVYSQCGAILQGR